VITVSSKEHTLTPIYIARFPQCALCSAAACGPKAAHKSNFCRQRSSVDL